MPEGHTIHRLARSHAQAFAGRRVAVSSPQGRFSGGAARLDGKVLEDVQAFGKHLLYRWAGGDVLHVHLGLVGAFRTYWQDLPEPSAQTRLVLACPATDTAAHLTGPLACELIAPEEAGALRARLGPDPLAEPDASDVFAARLARRRSPIGQVLLDQAVVAGVGNAYRAEALFLSGLDPQRPAGDLTPGEAAGLWQTLCRLLGEGARTGRIHTVATIAPADDAEPARYVYAREGSPCRRCAGTIESWPLGGRAMYACPSCQVRPGAARGSAHP